MTNGHGIPCKECTAHSRIDGSVSDTKEELLCMRQKFHNMEDHSDLSHKELHKRIDDIVKTKTSTKLFMWVIGGILSAMILVSAFMWEGIKAAEMEDRAFQREVGNQMQEISIDLRVIKSELKK